MVVNKRFKSIDRLLGIYSPFGVLHSPMECRIINMLVTKTDIDKLRFVFVVRFGNDIFKDVIEVEADLMKDKNHYTAYQVVLKGMFGLDMDWALSNRDRGKQFSASDWVKY